MKWLLLIHRIPPKPGYLRVKVWRRLQGVGAIALKNSVYALPCTEQAHEDFKWISQEVQRSGGEATICEARLLDGLSDGEVERLFNAARDDDYGALADEARALTASLPDAALLEGGARSALEADLVRLRRRFDSLAKVDYFGARRRMDAEAAFSRIEARLKQPEGETSASSAVPVPGRYRGRVWVTRKGIHVDRIASAWLIRRFIDPDATLRFVLDRAYEHEDGELRFDMFEGEFTHEGDSCTFEVLIGRFNLIDPALRSIAEIIHDIDLKESKFGRPETAGFERLIAGIAVAHNDDEDRLARGSAVLDDLFEAFRRYSA